MPVTRCTTGNRRRRVYSVFKLQEQPFVRANTKGTSWLLKNGGQKGTKIIINSNGQYYRSIRRILIMNLRYEIKSYIMREGATLSDVTEQLARRYGWKNSVSSLSSKLSRETLRYKDAKELADVLGYDIVWMKRKWSLRDHFAAPLSTKFSVEKSEYFDGLFLWDTQVVKPTKNMEKKSTDINNKIAFLFHCKGQESWIELWWIFGK